MNPESIRQVAAELINKERWSDLIERFIDVLKINVFLVDHEGRTILPPLKERYGWQLLATSPISLDLLTEHSILLEKFKKHGFYLEYSHLFDVHSFAIPINVTEDMTIAYLVLGPVILNKRLEKSEYKAMADNLKMNTKDLLEAINEIRVLSFIGLKSILDLLDELARYIIQLNFQAQSAKKLKLKSETLPKELQDVAQDIYSLICFDELLVTFLDVALNLTKTECGSIMILNDTNKELSIRVSRGIKNDIAKTARIKVGERVAGLAARENRSFLISGTESGDNRLKPYLTRPEIKHALITPLLAKNRVFGVLNLHTKTEKNPLDAESLDTVQMLSKLTSVAISNIQQKILP